MGGNAHYSGICRKFGCTRLGFRRFSCHFCNSLIKIQCPRIYKTQVLASQNVFRFPSSNNPLPNITNPNWQVASLTGCHELSGCLVSGTPLLSSSWTATSIWSKATFVTWIEAPPSQIEMLSILKVQSTNNSYRSPRLSLSVTTVRSFCGLEAYRALIFNGCI